MTNLITNKTYLKNKCEGVSNPGVVLQTLKDNFDKERYLGLSAIQIGINARVSVVWDSKNETWIDIIDWKIVDKKDKFLSYEACLSLPGAVYLVPRYRNITTEDLDGNKTDWYYGEDGKRTLDCNNVMIAIQQEIDHYNGIILDDIAVKTMTIKEFMKPKRNDLCNCGTGKKFKKCCGK